MSFIFSLASLFSQVLYKEDVPFFESQEFSEICFLPGSNPGQFWGVGWGWSSVRGGGVSEPQALLEARNKIGRPRAPRLRKLPAPQGPVHWTQTPS